MEYRYGNKLVQPWRKGFEKLGRQYARGSAIICTEGTSLVCAVGANIDDDEQHGFKVDFFTLLGFFLKHGKFDHTQTQFLINVLQALEYNETDIDAVFKYMIYLSKEDIEFIESVNNLRFLSSIAKIGESDIYGFVHDCLPTKELKAVALEYLQSPKLAVVLDKNLLEILNKYASEEVLRDRLISFLEVQCML